MGGFGDAMRRQRVAVAVKATTTTTTPTMTTTTTACETCAGSLDAHVQDGGGLVRYREWPAATRPARVAAGGDDVPRASRPCPRARQMSPLCCPAAWSKRVPRPPRRVNWRARASVG